MSQLQIILVSLIPLYAIACFFLLSPLVTYFQRRGLASSCVKTERFLSGSIFGLVTYICGNIGAGKTTCGAGICNVLSKIKKEQAYQKIQQVSLILPDLDYNKIDSIISLAFSLKLTNTDAILQFLLDKDEKIKSYISDNFYDNGLYPLTRVSLLRDYIDAYLAIIRNRYVYFNRRKFYCYVTDTWAMNYTPAMIDLKDRHLTQDWKIQRYSVIFEDEKILSGKVSTNYQEVAYEDGGADSFLRLIRQMGKGTIHYISTAQDFDRIVKQERELATGIFYIQKRKENPIIDLRYFLNEFLLDLLQRWEFCIESFVDYFCSSRLKFWMKRKRILEENSLPIDEVNSKVEKYSIQFSKKANFLKKKIALLTQQQEKYFADGYLTYQGVYYTSASDVGKSKQDCSSLRLDLKLTFPLRYCYGSTDSYAFSIFNDWLSLESIESSDYYDPADHAIPREKDSDVEDYLNSVVKKRTPKSRRRSSLHISEA